MIPEYREILEKVYEMIDGNEHTSVPEENIRGALGQELNEYRKIVDWLIGEGFVKQGPIGNIHVTYEGIKEVEKEPTSGK